MTEHCTNCDQPLPDGPEVVLDDFAEAGVWNAFCSDECARTWRSVVRNVVLASEPNPIPSL
jgi:predicted nucleic acid-binding Zn ribbon protein